MTTALYAEYGLDYKYCFNRKEVKDHGEGGTFVGYTDLKGKNVLIVDDVITAGTAIRESVSMLQGAGARVVGVVVAMDRQEKQGKVDSSTGVETLGEKSAIQEVEADFGFPVVSIIKLEHLVTYLGNSDASDSKHLDAVSKYKFKYGCN